MKKTHRMSAPAIGGSSLLVIFAVLCLTVFALLSLSTAQAEKRMSDASAQALTAYYAADLEAEQIFARLRAGENVPGVQENAGLYSYSCPISEYQVLEVGLENKENIWRVCRWQVIARSGAVSETLPVWNGT
jgi:hypothetical protein